MGRGSRHSKNAGTMGSETMTYAERRALGYGTAHERLGKDSLGNFDDCRLTLQPAIDPVCTPEGIIYSKEAILEALVHQKKEIKRKTAAWEEMKKREEASEADQKALEEAARLAAFERVNHQGASDSKAAQIGARLLEDASRAREMARATASANHDRVREVKAFWGQGKTPEAGPTPTAVLDKPKNETVCPMTGKKLKMKDLVELKFTKATADDQKLGAKYMDPLTKDVFTNRSRLVAIRQTGDVVAYETWKKLIEPEGTWKTYKIHPKSDIIELQRGGTGYAEHDKQALNAKKHTLVGLGSGMTDLRGQHAGSAARSGLVMI